MMRAVRRQFTTVTVCGRSPAPTRWGLVAVHAHHPAFQGAGRARGSEPTQRIFRVGDISIETAGETSRLTIPDVDDPQTIAD